MRRKGVRPYLGPKWHKNRRFVLAKLPNTLHILNMREEFLDPVRKITNSLVGSYLLCYYYLFEILSKAHVDEEPIYVLQAKRRRMVWYYNQNIEIFIIMYHRDNG